MKKMILWLFILLALGLSGNKAFAGTKVVDGRIVFDVACGTCAPIIPQDFELNLSTCLLVIIDGNLEIGFEGYSDWISCQTKPGLRRKYRKLQSIIDSFGVLPASLTQDLKERAGWLRSYYLSLP